MKKKYKSLLLKVVFITFGSILYSIGISLFLDPNKLAPGGTTGIAIVINYLVHIKTGTILFLINVPILIFGLWRFGLKLTVSTIYVTTISSFFMNFLTENYVQVYGAVTEDLLLAGVAGGSFMAVGMAIVFRQGATTGGTDIIVRALRQKYRHIKTGTIYIVTDSIIIIASAVIFKNVEIAMYAAITVVISNYVLDKVLYGGDRAELLYIISDNISNIANRIINEVDIGVTYLNGEGAYTAKNKKVIMCVCKNYNYTKVREIVKQEDSEAFLIVTSANEVFGDGYKSHLTDEI